MTDSIDQALVIEFSSAVIILAQQMQSRFRGKVREKPVHGNEAAVERLDKVDSIEITTRHANTVAQDITHSRRQIKMREFRSTIFLDKFDEIQTLIDPKGEYARATARRLMVNFDEVVADAFFADVNTGRTFGTTVTFANDDGTTIPTGSTGLTYDKLLTAQENFINNNVGVDMEEKLFMAIAAQQNTNIMKEEELTSGDFNRQNDFIREKGRMVQAAGFELTHFSGTQSPAILNKTSTTRDCIAFTSDSIEVGINQDITIEVDKRPDKNNLWQVQASMFLGATRVDGAKVQKVQCTEV
jgi:hypothetical protein